MSYGNGAKEGKRFKQGTWIFMIPATSVTEEDTVNFHSDLQRPFLWKEQEKQKTVITQVLMTWISFFSGKVSC